VSDAVQHVTYKSENRDASPAGAPDAARHIELAALAVPHTARRARAVFGAVDHGRPDLQRYRRIRCRYRFHAVRGSVLAAHARQWKTSGTGWDSHESVRRNR